MKVEPFPTSDVTSQLAAMAVDDVLDDGEPETRPALLTARRHVDPVEALGEARQVLGRDAGPVVGHGDEAGGSAADGRLVRNADARCARRPCRT